MDGCGVFTYFTNQNSGYTWRDSQIEEKPDIGMMELSDTGWIATHFHVTPMIGGGEKITILFQKPKPGLLISFR